MKKDLDIPKLRTGESSIKPNLHNLSLARSSDLRSTQHLGSLRSTGLAGGLPSFNTGIRSSGLSGGFSSVDKRTKKATKKSDRAKKSISAEKQVSYQKSDSIENAYHSYDISISDTLDTNGVEFKPRDFLKADQDQFIEKEDESHQATKEKEKIDSKKIDLINIVSVSLLRSPNLEDGNDETRKELIK